MEPLVSVLANWHQQPFMSTAATNLEEANMSRPTFSLSKKLLVVSALVFGANGVTLGNDTGVDLFIAKSHAYSNACHVEVTEVQVERLEGRRRTLRPGA
jgi:hypothetical protein